METGILLYMRQEGRGIGFVNKIRAYGLQDYGFDTVEANLALGFRDDEREYSTAAHMLHSLKVKSIRLMTNNPRKIADLTAHGIEITDRIPVVVPPNPHNQFYLQTKALRSGHLIDFAGKEHLQEQMDLPVVAGMNDDQVEALQGTMTE
jgi:GTP cyclohydrolase II